MIIGGVVPVVNVKGVQSGQMVLDGATVAPVYRSDGSGTNLLFSNCLSSAYPTA
jgi:ABC-type phosphate transport system substrate-binding protein